MIWFLVIGLVAGWLASKIVKGKGYGLLGNLIIGVIGSFLGGYLFKLLNVSLAGTVGEIIMATVGAIVLLFAIRLIKK